MSFPPRIAPRLRETLAGKLRRVKEWAEGLADEDAEIELAAASRSLWEAMKPGVEEEAERAEAVGLILGKVIT